MNFFRQAVLLLPCGFLLAVLLFLLTHGRQDPGFGTYPFFEQWVGGALVAATPEARFVEQALLFFAPAYLVTLLFVLFVAVAETGLFGRKERQPDSPYRRVFGPVFAIVYMAASGALLFFGDRAASRLAPGALVAPLLVAAVPFGAAPLALLPAALLALPVAAISRVDPT